MGIPAETIRRRLLAMQASDCIPCDGRRNCKVVVRDGVNQEQRAEFDGWVVAHRGRLWPDEESGLVYYEIPLAELYAGE